MTFRYPLSLTLSAMTLIVPLLAPLTPARASSELVVYNFTGTHADGGYPHSNLCGDSAGNGYGTTESGALIGDGTVYKITPKGVLTTFHAFSGGPRDGGGPEAGLILARDGNFYGTTEGGGPSNEGTVFKITPSGQETVLYSFLRGTDGALPATALIQAKDGNLYGTTSQGGANGSGTVFKVTLSGQETILHSFGSPPDGYDPQSSLLQASDGNFYGTTSTGGVNYLGTVYKVTPSGQETVVYAFGGGPDGAAPETSLIQATDGNLYGTTYGGGANGRGAVYKLTLSGQETILYSFQTGMDGTYPSAAVIEGKDGSLYGTTSSGGLYRQGTVYKLLLSGQETVLHSFGNGTDGSDPEASLVQDKSGYFYGTTYSGGNPGYGTIFRITL